MSDDARQKRRPSPGQVMLFVLGGLVLYLLSPAPVLWLLIQVDGEGALLRMVTPTLSVFYYPVGQLQNNVPIIDSFYEAWFSLFSLGQ